MRHPERSERSERSRRTPWNNRGSSLVERRGPSTPLRSAQDDTTRSAQGIRRWPLLESERAAGFLNRGLGRFARLVRDDRQLLLQLTATENVHRVVGTADDASGEQSLL